VLGGLSNVTEPSATPPNLQISELFLVLPKNLLPTTATEACSCFAVVVVYYELSVWCKILLLREPRSLRRLRSEVESELLSQLYVSRLTDASSEALAEDLVAPVHVRPGRAIGQSSAPSSLRPYLIILKVEDEDAASERVYV
jgi:hypothetical protein